MKLRKLVVPAITLAFAANVAVVTAAQTDRVTDLRVTDQANDHRQHDRKRGVKHKVKRIFNALDTDENEIITLDEWVAKPVEKASNQFERIDTDDDGLISLEEFLAVGHDRETDERPDIDREAVRVCVQEHFDFEIPERPDRETRFNEIDTNGDGFIDLDEYVAAKTQQATDKFHRIDEDADGGITIRELYNALKQLREIKEVRRDCIEEQDDVEELLED